MRVIETSSKGLEFWLQFCTGAVVFGVLGEAWAVYAEYKEAAQAWLLGTIVPPEKPSIARFCIEIICALLVALGVAGELWVGVAITRKNGELQSKSAELRSKSLRIVALVNKEAIEANGRAVGAESANSLLKRQLKTEGHEARSREAQLRAQNLATEHELEIERRSSLELKKAVQWRQITPEDAEKIRPLVAPFAGTHFTLSANMGDSEGVWYALQLGSVLEKAGWIGPPTMGVDLGVYPIPPVGVSIWIGPSASYGPAKALKHALRGIGVDAPWSPKRAQPNDVVEILVGARPIKGLLHASEQNNQTVTQP